jgi:hypothetical protein
MGDPSGVRGCGVRGQCPTAGLTGVGALQARAFRGAGACIFGVPTGHPSCLTADQSSTRLSAVTSPGVPS